VSETAARPQTAAPAQISVQVRLFASYREAAGRSRLATTLPSGARVSDLIETLASTVPALRTTRGLMAVNHNYVNVDALLESGDEVAFIPPVSGGA
jgi:molybdopterin converting factor subunit 1